MRLILASASPRRADLLRAAGFDFDVRPVEVDETPWRAEDPTAYVLRLAVLKAHTCECSGDDRVVLAADTTVVVDGEILAKPVDAADASRMLQLLSGREHDVLTGIAVQRAARTVSGVERTRVRFLPMTSAEIAWYVASGQPADKAGAYGIQGLASRFIDHVEGSYPNVVGLPTSRIYQMLRDLIGEDGIAQLSLPPGIQTGLGPEPGARTGIRPGTGMGTGTGSV